MLAMAGIAHALRFRQIRFPLTAAQATIVLPDSPRSGSAVGIPFSTFSKEKALGNIVI
jgi:hypothetical protein